MAIYMASGIGIHKVVPCEQSPDCNEEINCFRKICRKKQFLAHENKNECHETTTKVLIVFCGSWKGR
jgi:hypothetical protein